MDNTNLQETSEHVITDIDGLFWTGNGWSEEYPEAELFSRFSNAAREARSIVAGFNITTLVVNQYGMDSERVVARFVRVGGV